jgi:hypothetical protein
MFPAGAAGIALLILRLAAAAALLESGLRHPLLATLTGTFVILALPGSALCLGVLPLDPPPDSDAPVKSFTVMLGTNDKTYIQGRLVTLTFEQ